ncbi:hypothetical protein WMY93_018218 [Mugilogobius chulae]|uniref:Uncharacterized protein n=1 Tax=Mugilogobius chulae TaxID=88201 RepID=A0AAW0NVH1_9GOBI
MQENLPLSNVLSFLLMKENVSLSDVLSFLLMQENLSLSNVLSFLLMQENVSLSNVLSFLLMQENVSLSNVLSFLLMQENVSLSNVLSFLLMQENVSLSNVLSFLLMLQNLSLSNVLSFLLMQDNVSMSNVLSFLLMLQNLSLSNVLSFLLMQDNVSMSNENVSLAYVLSFLLMQENVSLSNENVSLADILSLRDTCLSEDEVWAVCGECAVALQSISQSQLFHSLCITPDTLAFNAHGNVCFMEQLSGRSVSVPVHLSHTSSSAVCRRLSSVGRRNLSIESFQGVHGLGLLSLGRGHGQRDRPQHELQRRAGLPLLRQLSGDETGPRQVQPNLGALNRSCSVPDSNNPPAMSPTSCGDISFPVSDLSEIGADEDQPKSAWRLERLNRGSSCECYAVSTIEDYMNATMGRYDSRESLNEPLHIEEANREEKAEGLQSPCGSCQDLELEQDSCGKSLNNRLCTNNHMTKSMLCLNEESQDEWICLRELLTRCGRRLSVNELWALCYTCLSSLQTYIDSQVTYLSLDTVYVGCEGEVLYLKPKTCFVFIGYCDEFYLAPEYQEHGIVTEKVCIYGIAAILWATAKFNLSANQKLAMPRKLKRLLLEMAKRTPIERPTIVSAKKSCRDYLSRQGTSAETVWDKLISRVHKPSKYLEDSKTTEAQLLSNDDSSQLNSGFVPMATESRLAPVPGPIPHSYPENRELQLPEAFTSTATHFTPIILTNQDAAEKSPSVGDELEGYMEGLIDSSENIEEIGLDTFSVSEDPPASAQHDSCPSAEAENTTTTSPTPPAPVTSDPCLPDVSHIEVSLPSSLNSNLNNCGVFNNYLFRQDPKTGQLFLVPVQVRAPDSVQGLDINLSLVPQSLKGLLSNPQAKLMSPEVHPALQEVIDLLKGEFTLNTGLDNGHEDIAMGVSTDSSDAGVMEGGEHSAGASDESPSEADLALGRDEASMDLEDSDSGRRTGGFPRDGEGFRARGAGSSCLSSAWDLAFYEEQCFSEEVMKYAVDLGQHTGAAPCVDVKTQEVQQQLIIEKRNLRKTRNFYHKLLQQERKNKGSDNKAMLSKLKAQLEELRSRVIFLESVKKYLEVLSFDQWGLEVSLLPSLAHSGADSLELQSSEDSSVLTFSCCKGKNALQLGSPLGLMAHLFARNAAMDGYIQQFLYTFRYFCTADELLRFIMDKFMSAAREGPDLSGDSLKVFHRSLDLLQLWISDCKMVIPLDSRGESLLSALHSSTHTTWAQDRGSQLSLVDEDDLVCLHSSTEDLGKRWRISRVVEPSPSLPKDKSFSIAAALPVPCYGSLFEEQPSSCGHSEERLPFYQNDYSPQHLAQQLTLLQQEIFQKCHPVHFLNSRTQGVTDNALSSNKNMSSPACAAEGSGALSADHSSLQQLLSHSDSVAHWVCAEVLVCDCVKSQVALLTKYLWIGKHCYESRNFATAMQILGGLENVIVRQLPAWKQLPTKVCEILEELRAVQVFLKSDDLCLMGGDHMRRRPTLPSAHILALHVQQLEIGAFKLTTGAYKWNKLRRIAKVVSQVHAFQEAVFPYSPDRDLQSYLRVRITRMCSADIHQLASGNQANFQQTNSERQARRIHDTLRRVKASLQ